MMVMLWFSAGRGPNGTNIVGSLCQLYEASEEDVQKMMDKANDMIGRVLKISPASLPLNDSEQLADIDTGTLFVLVLDGFRC
jgi:retinoblastoma-like protein 1